MIDRKNLGVLLVSGAVALSAVAVALFTANIKEERAGETSTDALTVVAANSPESDAQFDTDGDGVPNWKEALFGTDPNNPDTDGDGVSDGDEIAQKSNATAYGVEPVEEGAYSAPRALPPTDALARELFVAYAAAKQNDGTIDSAEIRSAVNDLIANNAPETDSPPQPYALADVNIEDDVPAKAYAGGVEQALRASRQVREYELSVFARVVETKSHEEAAKLSATANIYRGIADALMALDTPSSVAPEHVALANSLVALAYEIDRLAGWVSGGDPYVALLLLGSYGRAEEAMSDDMNDLFSLVGALNT